MVRTGAEYTVFSAKDLKVDVSGRKAVSMMLGDETIDIYETEIESISIGEKDRGRIPGVGHVYVSDLEYFQATPVLGVDYLHNMAFSCSYEDDMELKFDPKDLGKMLTKGDGE